MFSFAEIADLSIPLPADFKGFDPYGELKIYQRNLPHWRQEGATYFVTFRQKDSIPISVWAELTEESNWWRQRMNGEVEITDELKREFAKFQRRYQTRIERALDECCGSCLLRDPKNQEEIETALFHFDEERYDLFAYVVMPNHCHLIARPREEHALEAILESWKKFTSRRIAAEPGDFWKEESHDRIVRDSDHYRKSVRYVLKNPIKANLPEGDAVCYVKGLLEERKTTLQSRSGAD